MSAETIMIITASDIRNLAAACMEPRCELKPPQFAGILIGHAENLEKSVRESREKTI